MARVEGKSSNLRRRLKLVAGRKGDKNRKGLEAFERRRL